MTKERVECDGVAFEVSWNTRGEVSLGVESPAVPKGWSPLLSKNQALGLGYALLWAAHEGDYP